MWSKKKLVWTDAETYSYNHAMLTLTDCQLCGSSLPKEVDKFMVEARRVCNKCWEKCMKGDYNFVVKGFENGLHLK